jgi:hypothetical protein
MAYGFLGKRMDFKKWIPISIGVAISQHFIRANIDSYIIYTSIILLIYIITGIIINRGHVFKWTISILVSESIGFALEFVFIQSLILIFNVNPLDFSKDIILALKCFTPQIIVHSIMAIVIYKRRITVFIENR